MRQNTSGCVKTNLFQLFRRLLMKVNTPNQPKTCNDTQNNLKWLISIQFYLVGMVNSLWIKHLPVLTYVHSQPSNRKLVMEFQPVTIHTMSHNGHTYYKQ